VSLKAIVSVVLGARADLRANDALMEQWWQEHIESKAASS
jgi:hypothetical protein